MKNIFSDIAMGGLFLLTLIAAHTAFSASTIPSLSQHPQQVERSSSGHLKKISSLSPTKDQRTSISHAQKSKENIDHAPAPSSTENTSKSTPIRSYKQWKSDQIQAAIQRVVAAKIVVQKAPIPRAYQQLAIEELGLNTAKSLTLKDYIAMYLGTQPDRQFALIQGAKLLSQDEVQTVLEELAAPTRR